MPKVSEHQQAGLRRIIRDAMAIDPLITLQGICGVVEKKISRPVDPRFIKTLIRKVTGEMAVVADREKVEKRIQDLRESNRIICDELLRIAFPPDTLQGADRPGIVDRRKALEAIARIQNAQVKLEMDLGLFTRHLGEIDIGVRMKPMEEDTRLKIVDAFKAWGLTPPQMRRIEPGKIVDVESTSIPNEPPKQQPAPASTQSQAIPITTGAGLVPTE